MTAQAGKRYVCQVCGSEMLVTRDNGVELTCCGQAMQVKGGAAAAGQGAAGGQASNQEA